MRRPWENRLNATASITSLPRVLVDALKRGALTHEAVSRIVAGERDIDTLTNLIFYARHPEREGRRLDPRELGYRQLAREGLQIRDYLVRPVLDALSAEAEAPGPSSPPLAANRFLGLDAASVDKNEAPNWEKSKVEGAISFAIIRSNFGAAQDRLFVRHWPQIKKAGIVRGAYLFLRFPHPKHGPPADPVTQARAFINTINKVGGFTKGDLPPTLDVEFPGGQKVTGMTSRQLLTGVRAAWKVLKDNWGVAPIIYTSGRVWEEDFKNLPAPDLMESPLWLAHYFFKEHTAAVLDARAFRLDPRMPCTRRIARGRDGRAFRNDSKVSCTWGDADNWWIHQYQGDAWKLPGFRQVDMNRFNTLIKGATGGRVKWVQRRLGISQTGQFDAAMESAMRAFQNLKGLASDGRVDPQTFAYLNAKTQGLRRFLCLMERSRRFTT